MHDGKVPIDDRGFAYGDGLFETVLVRDNRPLLWNEHLMRLARGCERLAIPFPDRAMLDALPYQAGPGLHLLKIIVTRGSGGRGYLPPDEAEPRLRWQVMHFTPAPYRWREGVRLRLCELRLGIQPRLAGLKHLNRLENVLARQEWRDEGIAEGVLCDSEGCVVEATCMNLFWLQDGCLETPRLDRCGVAGTLRAALLASQPIDEVSRHADELDTVQALWLGNSVQGVWPVTQLEAADGKVIRQWALGPAHRLLQMKAHELLGYPSTF
ncbi:4-amino-4-deoxychorismate lyase [Modicisalibacter ilicicola DSM 19980]|uniref:Aminodeoxychorismate lyase n=1 Tax=Modicisalibacter ilicicola DSM 19980 TaxID=1121942 RepID=A0A1M5CGX4_9GAMM|nr:aminodeoxychorismate lyase [Halomonas ilicicola]SHF53979.1 4-amino-4-deoxychorismate lyase [Halomonas ilicicola DSM 19980]